MERRGLTVTRERVNEIVGAFLGVDESGAAAGVGAVPAGQGAVLAQPGRLSQRVCRGGQGVLRVTRAAAAQLSMFVVVDMSYFSLSLSFREAYIAALAFACRKHFSGGTKSRIGIVAFRGVASN